MISITVNINAIIMCCDESALNIALGNNYTMQKVYLKDFEHKDDICNAQGNLSIDYMGSRLFDDMGEIYFICLHKCETFVVQGLAMEIGKTYTDNDFDFENEIESFQERECIFLNNVFNLLHLYKSGNIGLKSVFFDYTYNWLGFFNKKLKNISTSVTRNVTDNRFFILSEEEANNCNEFIGHVNSNEFHIIKGVVDEFVWGLEQVDLPTGFEQYTTALEMMLLEHNQQNKKECLSKRISVLLGETNAEIVAIYSRIKAFYRYRSESLHEGDGQNITACEIIELETITRRSIVKIMDMCATGLIAQPLSTWASLKSSVISDLKNQVGALITAGVLPQ